MNQQIFVSLDLETTGFDKEKDQIIEFGAVKFNLDGSINETLQFLINPKTTIPEVVSHITNIFDKDVKDAPFFEHKKQEIIDFVEDYPIIGHNIQFDTNFLKTKGIPLINSEYDTCELASILIPGLPSYSLEIIAAILKLQHHEAHRALDDAIAAQYLFIELIKQFSGLPKELIDQIKTLSLKSEWPLKELLQHIEHIPNSGQTIEIADYGDTDPVYPAQRLSDEQLKSITNTAHTQLYDFSPPYQEAIHQIIETASPETYISLPTSLFRKIESTIPDNIAKLEQPQNYVSPSRLEEFKNKDNYKSHEFTALLKYLVWINQTKTGLLHEIKFLGKETQTLNQVCIDHHINALENEPFYQKALENDRKNPAICSHEYLISNNLHIKDLIIFNLENLTKTLHSNLSSYIKLDYLISTLEQLKTPDNTPLIGELITKSEILFGMIGIIFSNNNDDNFYSPKALITPELITSHNWQQAKISLKNLITASINLGDLNTRENQSTLQNWKHLLEKLHLMLITPHLEENTIWIEKDYSENIILRQNFNSIKDPLNQILKNCNHYRIISENLDLNDNGAFIKTLFGLDPDLPLENLDPKQENRNNITILNDIPDNDQHEKNTIEFLQEYIEKSTGNISIILNSKQKLRQLTIPLSRHFKNSPIKIISQLTGSLGKITQQFNQAGNQDPKDKAVVIMTSGFWENFRYQDQISHLIIHKIPFDPPSDTYLMSLSKQFTDPFNELQVPRAVIKMKKIINRINPENQIIILDGRLLTKNYGRQFIENFGSIPIITQTKALL
ncbi:hypothetical protein CVV38_00380 [Candidatus Peregrinibacteria bacterium HGW-Peregrinibacteria-1]|nr:MAG: hypothetical protein CVV38_00380 [Candidatus Peregrinibacteria bacterium HGW-Peregrinibacteria-1]